MYLGVSAMLVFPVVLNTYLLCCSGVSRDEQVSGPALDAVRHVLADGSWPELALEAVQLVADLIRKRKCSCSPQVQSLAGASEHADGWPPAECAAPDKRAVQADMHIMKRALPCVPAVTQATDTPPLSQVPDSVWIAGAQPAGGVFLSSVRWCTGAGGAVWATPGRGDHDGGQAAGARRRRRPRAPEERRSEDGRPERRG